MPAFDDFLQGAPTPSVDELTVTASPKAPPQGGDLTPQPLPDSSGLQSLLPGPVDKGADQGAQMPGINYNNSMAAGAVGDALSGEPATRGGSSNPGLYGLLPQGLQHGTLRNMLGALGDAFLVGSGKQAQYGPRMDRQEIGKAMAGYDPNDPQSVQAAIQRIASTGAKGSTEMADQLQKNFESTQLRKQLMQQNANYHNQTIQSRNDSLFNRMNPVAQADLAQAKDAADYKARLERWNTRLKAIDPNADAVSAFGVPEEFAPGGVSQTAGMTGNQITQSADRAAGRRTSERNTDVRSAATIRAAGMNVNERATASNKPTASTILQGLVTKQNNGQTLTPAEQATFDHMTQVAKKGRTLPANLTVGGGQPVPTAADRAYVKAHPETAGAFRAHFKVNP